ncbi:CoA pyrophosphatase [Paludibacterium yongneupense]|uniref:CoA pyrophosphatase n=1 Tax=Paludibacterium yongneupense TaxID=400061 RepID=UPI0004031510|nr:CoA pyrophosphatase [Paludibacterium yongneupense]
MRALPDDTLQAEAWLRERLAAGPASGWHGDLPLRKASSDDRPAAVLVPLVWHADEPPTVLLTRRSDTLPTHAGQVSFPGGKVDAGDRDAVDTALREAEEEIGLARERVTVVGVLPPYVTITHFVVTPVVALLSAPLQLRPEPGEVAGIIEVPLARALDPANYTRHDYERDDVRGQYLALAGTPVWGATAAMLRLLAATLTRCA